MKIRFALLALPAVGVGSAFADETPATVQLASGTSDWGDASEFSREFVAQTPVLISDGADENHVITLKALAASVAAPSDDEDSDIQSPDLSGFGFGLAVNYSFEDEINDAFLDSNGTIRTNEKTRGDASFILEGHFLAQVNNFWPFSIPCAQVGDTVGAGQLLCGSGPFVALKSGGSTVLVESVGLGWMWGVKHNGESTPMGGLQQFNFGLGVSIDPSVKTLANGFEQDEPLPSGETEIRYEDDMTVGLMAIFSIGL